ncbi:endonuclease G, mitochondrial (plasmid) [Pararobbsia alpina]|uniref:DNA/RNA non-specific endonuclease n=1 Tax=Pararobbsia alpina TaxID=621374 RepID=UPI0039A77EAA
MKSLIIALSLTIASNLVNASCADHFVGGRPPTTRLSEKTHYLCFSSYSVLESGQTRTGVWSAEHLTRKAVEGARGISRDNEFRAEDSIAPSDRAELDDYRHSGGFDRGHLTPSGDAGDPQSQYETFTLANVLPQYRDNNRRVWEHLEYATRLLAKRVGDIYVVTGPGYTSTAPRYLNARVRIPDFIWKAIDIPGQGAAAYVTRNDTGQDYAIVSVADITRISGVDPFPSLSSAVKHVAIDLPSPVPHRGEEADNQLSPSALFARATERPNDDTARRYRCPGRQYRSD